MYTEFPCPGAQCKSTSCVALTQALTHSLRLRDPLALEPLHLRTLRALPPRPCEKFALPVSA